MKHVRQRFGRVCVAVCGAALLATNAAATSLWVSDATVAPRDEKTAFLKFDVAWKDSWRNEHNQDAVWVFFKVRAEGEAGAEAEPSRQPAESAQQWRHVRLAANRVLNPDGYEQSRDATPLDFIVPAGPDGFMGVFLRRAEYSRLSEVKTNSVTVIWDRAAIKGLPENAKVQVKAYGIEMVYVPEGAFYLGTGGAEANAFYKFTDGIHDDQPYLVNNAGPIPTGRKNGNLWAGGATPQDGGAIPAAFPNGYAAFYCMKFPIHQWEYADFLNSLTPEQADKHYHARLAVRSGSASNYVYSSHAPRSKKAVPCVGLSWGDGAAFAAWAGLRPLTELELEKAVRGPREPILDELRISYWWVEGIQAARHGEPYEPLRPASGIIMGGWIQRMVEGHGATSRTCPTIAIEQSERAVSAGNAAGRKFAGTHGCGTPDLPGDWPQEDAVGAGMRMSWWGFGNRENNSEREIMADRPDVWRQAGAGQFSRRLVSDRQNASLTDPERRPHHRWRGGRTAPAEAAESAEAVESHAVAGRP